MADLKEQILARIEVQEVIDLARELVRIPSYTADETSLAEYIHSFLKKEGFESQLQEVDPGRFQTIARLPGGGGAPSLMFDGHLDIDPIPSGWVRDPWQPTIEGDRFYGAGIYNMKGGDAAMIMAAVAARRSGVRLRGDVILACVVGELQGGVGTTHMLRSGIRADMAIVPEPYDTQNIITKHTGVMEFLIHVIGRSIHVSRMEHGVNAIGLASRAIQALEQLRFRGELDPDLPGLPRLCVGSIIGGRGREWELRGPNMTPDFCSLFVDVRFPSGMTPESILADVQGSLDALTSTDRPFRYEIEFPARPERRIMREVMRPVSVPVNADVVRILARNVEAVRGTAPTIGAVLPYSYAGNDTSHLYYAGIPCCLYGPFGGFDEGRSDRWTSVEQIVTCSRVLGSMIADVCA